jgi:uncharacterized protein with ParB-like and HNH nuclease domain
LIKNVNKTYFNKFLGSGTGRLELPQYQRSFSWNKSNISDFMKDLKLHAFSVEEDVWYLGSFFTVKTTAVSKEILDGQQRLTTFFILLKELTLFNFDIEDLDNRNKFRDLALSKLTKFIFSDDDSPRLTLDLGNQKCFNDYLRAESKPEAKFNPNLGSQVKLDIALNEIRRHLRKYIGQDYEKFKTIVDFICNNVQVIDIELKEDANFSRVFEGVNNRGVGLSYSDLFKNLFLLYEKDKDKRDEFNKSWFLNHQTMYKIGKDLDDDVMYYMHLSRGIDPNEGIINKLKKEISKLENNRKNVSKFLNNRYTKIQRDVDAISSIFKKSDYIDDDFSNLYFNPQLRDENLVLQSKYVALMAYATWKNIKQFGIVFYALTQKHNFTNEKDNFKVLLKEISIAIRFYLMKHILGDKGNNLRIEATKLAKYILEKDSKSILHCGEVKNVYSRMKLKNINSEDMLKLNNSTSALFLMFIQISIKPNQFNSGQGSFKKDWSLEHLAPKSWEEHWMNLKINDSDWENLYKKYGSQGDGSGLLSVKFDNDSLNKIKNYQLQELLGNKFLLSIKLNKKVQNKDFDYKKEYIQDEQGVSFPNLENCKNIDSLDSHNISDILFRTETLAKYLKDSLLKKTIF